MGGGDEGRALPWDVIGVDDAEAQPRPQCRTQDASQDRSCPGDLCHRGRTVTTVTVGSPVPGPVSSDHAGVNTSAEFWPPNPIEVESTA